MCGRFTLFATHVAVGDLFEAVAPDDLAPRYNIAPTQPVLACRVGPERQARELVRFRWGLVPGWAHDLKAGVKAINARAETIADRPTFRAAFCKRRCLVPASGYFEWQKSGKAKQPFFIHPRAAELFAFAGLWETWDRDGGPVESCAIITTTANEALRTFHERMPVILPAESFSAWLDPAAEQPALLDMLRPCPTEWVAAHAVDARVGNVRNDDAALVAPAGDLFPA
jgi:putative SOS response-associated peptidase YedK